MERGAISVGFPRTRRGRFNSAVFQTGSGVPDLQELAFAAGLNENGIVAGQNVLIAANMASISTYPVYLPATTVTLLLQAMDGTGTGISDSGVFPVWCPFGGLA
jgi:hypothetical protein